MENSNIPTGKLSNVKKMMDAIKDEIEEPKMTNLDMQELSAIAERVKEVGWDAKEYNSLWGFFAIPLLLVSALMINSYGYYYAIPFMLFVIFYLYQKSSISTKLSSQKLEEVYKENGFISAMQWVKDGVDLRLSRINYSNLLLTIFLPFIIWFGIEIIKGKLDTNTAAAILIGSMLISGILWYFFFSKDRKDIDKIYKDIESLKGHYVSRGAV